MSASKKSKNTVKRHGTYLNDLRKHKVTLMARFGGFSHRAIAKSVLGTPFELDDDTSVLERKAISAYLHREGIKLSDWRNGMSLSAQGHIGKLLKIKKSLQKRLQERRMVKT